MQNKKLQYKKSGLTISIVILGKAYQNQVTTFLNQTFCKDNPIWSRYVKNTLQTYPYVNQIVKRSIQLNMLYGLIDDQTKKIISVVTYFDMIDYIQLLQSIKGKYNHIKLVSQLSTYGAQLQKQIRTQKYQRGTAIYGWLGATASQYASSQYNLLLSSVAFNNFHSIGYKYYFARGSNKISKKSMVKSGFQILKEIQIPNTGLMFSLGRFQFKILDQIPQNVILQFWDSLNFTPHL